MRDTAIVAEALSKRYRLGTGGYHDYGRLTESLANALRAPYRWVRRSRRPSDGPSQKHVWALKNVSFEVREGDVLGIIGRNGAGKSTLLKILSRITYPTDGRVRIEGRIGSLLEVGTGFHPELTGRENIMLNGAILGMRRSEILRKMDSIIDFADIARFLDTPVKRYSSGMYVRLAFSVAAHLEPDILLVDEVLAVGDAAFQRKCLGLLGDVSRQGRTVIFVSHNMGAVQSLCRTGMLLEGGTIRSSGPIETVIEDYMQMIRTTSPSARKDPFPAIFDGVHGIGITGCEAVLEPDGTWRTLRVTVDVESKGQVRDIGVGVRIKTLSGVLVASLNPALTDFSIPLADGRLGCVISVPEFDRHVSGGEYSVTVFLSKPFRKALVTAEDAALVEVPARDLFGTGRPFTTRFGVVPLPAEFTVLGDARDEELPLPSRAVDANDRPSPR